MLGWVVAGCWQLVILTTMAMLVYPGGTIGDPTTRRYSFFRNFFSDLGRTVSVDGTPNTLSAILFFVALTWAGLALTLFFVVMPSFLRRPWPARVLSLSGSLLGIVAGLSFVGVACCPANLFLPPHKIFVQVAFVAFFAAALGYTAAILLAEDYPRGYAIILAPFTLLMAAYLWLLFFGPGLDSPHGLVIQATGQKIIVYAATVSVGIQAMGARRVA
jgi:hypothetical membrane protein